MVIKELNVNPATVPVDATGMLNKVPRLRLQAEDFVRPSDY